MPRGCRTRRPTAPVQRLTRNRVVKTAVKAAQRRPVNISSIDELIELERQKKLDDAEKRQKILDASEPQMRALEYLFRVTEIDPEYRGDEWKDIGKLEPRDDGVIEGLPLEEGGISYKRLTKHHFNLALDFILRQDLQLDAPSALRPLLVARPDAAFLTARLIARRIQVSFETMDKGSTSDEFYEALGKILLQIKDYVKNRPPVGIALKHAYDLMFLVKRTSFFHSAEQSGDVSRLARGFDRLADELFAAIIVRRLDAGFGWDWNSDLVVLKMEAAYMLDKSVTVWYPETEIALDIYARVARINE